MSRLARKYGARSSLARRVFDRFVVALGAIGLTVAVFLVLPLLQAISEPPDLGAEPPPVDIAVLPTPDPPEEEEEPEPEPEPEPETLEMDEPAPMLDLAQMDLLLEPGFGEGGFGSGLLLDLKTGLGGDGQADELFALADLDREPRVISQPGPILTGKLRSRGPGRVYVVFIVDKDGRVKTPKAQSSTDPVFERPAVDAVKKWKFEPGERRGEPVSFRMRVPISFPKG